MSHVQQCNGFAMHALVPLVVAAVAAASGAADDHDWVAPAYFEPQQAVYLLGTSCYIAPLCGGPEPSTPAA